MQKIKQLKRMLNESNGIKKVVITEALNNSIDDNELLNWFSYIVNYGTNSGSVSFLIYYVDTHAFFDEHYYEIEELRNEAIEDGFGIEIKGDLKDFLARFGFEVVARKLADTLFPDTL